MRLTVCSFVLLLGLFSVVGAVIAPDASYPSYPAIRTAAQETMSSLPSQSTPVLARLKTLTGSDWNGYARNDGISSWRVFGTGLHSQFPNNSDDAFQIAENLLPGILTAVYGVPVELKRLTANRGGARWYVDFVQTIDGVAIDGATVSLRITDKGCIPLLQLGIVDPRIAGEYRGIGEAAISSIVAGIAKGTVESVERVWLLRDGTFVTGPKLQSCYVVKVDVATDNKPVLYLDAQSGTVVGGWNRVNFDWATAKVTGGIHPYYRTDSLRYLPMELDTVKLDNYNLITDANGFARRQFTFTLQYDTASAYLRGRYADVRPYSSTQRRARATGRNIDTVLVRFDSSNSRQSEPNMYYHLNVVHDYFKILDPHFAGPDYMIPARIDRSNYANAYWDGTGCTFGDGGGTYDNFAMYSDVIYHEFIHGVTQYQYSGINFPYSGETGAMNEGWSDYFACTITNEPYIGEGGLVGGGAMRDLTNNLRYPQAITHEVHDDSRMFSGSLWRLRTRIGASIVDTLSHFTKYAHAQNFYDSFVDLLEHDDTDGNLVNGTPHAGDIYWAFGDCHGIGPGTMPNLVVSNLNTRIDGQGGSIGNSDRYFDIGETMAMSLQIKNDVTLYPPPASNVVLSFRCDDPGLVLPAPRTLANLNARDSITISQIQFRNNSQISHWTTIYIVRTANPTYMKVDTFKVLLGHPHLMLYSADSTARLIRYVTDNLDSMRIGYYLVRAGTGVDPATIMPDHDRLLWLGGNAQTIMSSANAAALVTYLNRGGKLFVSAQNLRAISLYPALQSLMHFSIVSDSLHDMHHLDGEPNQPLAVPALYIIGATGAYNQTAPDAIQPVTGAYTLYRYSDTAGIIGGTAYGDEAHPELARIVVFGFGIESIHRGSTLYAFPEMIQPIFNWFDGVLSTPQPHSALPVEFSLHAYPNPFNSELRVSVTLPKAGTLSIALVDVLGRTVWLQTRPAAVGQVTTTIEGSQFASGIYFLRVNAPGNYAVMKKVTYLK